MAFKAKNYIKGWKKLAKEHKERTHWMCEWCGVAQKTIRMGTKRKRPYVVYLSVAHLNHDTTDNRPENLRSLCQACHQRHDRFQHATNAKATHYRKIIGAMLNAGQLPFDFFEGLQS